MSTQSASEGAETPDENFPEAIIQRESSVRGWFASKLWWVTGLCVAISLGLVAYSRQQNGPLIEIGFRDGHGLKTEDRLRYHGIDVGSIENVELSDDFEGVMVRVRLTPNARMLVREGSKFWIVRPVLSLDSIQGLDTIVGAKYISIEPGPIDSKPQTKFQGLEAPPVIAPPDGSLEISLDAKSRGGLENGAPILFRGFQIGSVLQVGLASDARTVRARCAIDSEYRDLVRRNSKFWNRSGWRLEIGVTGIRLDADTLAQVVSGGVEMATPDEPEEGVSTGYRFELFEKPPSEWEAWQPSLPHGQTWNRLESKMPQPIRMALRWQERSFGFRKNHQRLGWCLPLSDGSVLCMSDQIDAPKSALAKSVIIELAGISLTTEEWGLAKKPGEKADSNTFAEGYVSRFIPSKPLPADLPRWPVNNVSLALPKIATDVVIANAEGLNAVAIDAARLKPIEGGWQVDEQVKIDAALNGLPVVSAETSQVLGVIVLQGKKWTIVSQKESHAD